MPLATPPQSDPQPESQPSPSVLAGRTVRMMRKAHGVTLRDMAALVGLSPGHLSRIESGERVAAPDLLNRICDAIATLPVTDAKESA